MKTFTLASAEGGPRNGDFAGPEPEPEPLTAAALWSWRVPESGAAGVFRASGSLLSVLFQFPLHLMKYALP